MYCPKQLCYKFQNLNFIDPTEERKRKIGHVVVFRVNGRCDSRRQKSTISISNDFRQQRRRQLCDYGKSESKQEKECITRGLSDFKEKRQFVYLELLLLCFTSVFLGPAALNINNCQVLRSLSKQKWKSLTRKAHTTLPGQAHAVAPVVPAAEHRRRALSVWMQTYERRAWNRISALTGSGHMPHARAHARKRDSWIIHYHCVTQTKLSLFLSAPSLLGARFVSVAWQCTCAVQQKRTSVLIESDSLTNGMSSHRFSSIWAHTSQCHRTNGRRKCWKLCIKLFCGRICIHYNAAIIIILSEWQQRADCSGQKWTEQKTINSMTDTENVLTIVGLFHVFIYLFVVKCVSCLFMAASHSPFTNSLSNSHAMNSKRLFSFENKMVFRCGRVRCFMWIVNWYQMRNDWYYFVMTMRRWIVFRPQPAPAPSEPCPDQRRSTKLIFHWMISAQLDADTRVPGYNVLHGPFDNVPLCVCVYGESTANDACTACGP